MNIQEIEGRLAAVLDEAFGETAGNYGNAMKIAKRKIAKDRGLLLGLFDDFWDTAMRKRMKAAQDRWNARTESSWPSILTRYSPQPWGYGIL